MTPLQDKAARLLQLHQQGGLLLPNAWDAASARLFEDAGFPAIATTSAGVAFAYGYADGQNISRDEMLSVVARIAAAVQVPVTADVEAGYGTAPEAVAHTIAGVIAAGAVGVNLEDNTGRGNPLLPIEQQVSASLWPAQPHSRAACMSSSTRALTTIFSLSAQRKPVWTIH
ncbi:MAG: isocitrate lyase/phosphoenolpyruvate mutase family protein [Anaerolineae bacterium]